MPGNSEERKTQASASEKQLTKPGSQETSISLSKDLATQLLSLMTKVTKDEVTPDTVNAACNCASEIHKILRLNFAMKKEGF